MTTPGPAFLFTRIKVDGVVFTTDEDRCPPIRPDGTPHQHWLCCSRWCTAAPDDGCPCGRTMRGPADQATYYR